MADDLDRGQQWQREVGVVLLRSSPLTRRRLASLMAPRKATGVDVPVELERAEQVCESTRSPMTSACPQNVERDTRFTVQMQAAAQAQKRLRPVSKEDWTANLWTAISPLPDA